MKRKAYLFVFLQFSSLAAVLLTGPWLAKTLYGILLEASGLLLGFAAIFTMKIGNFSVAPLPHPGGKLVTSGVYRFIRHPMYLAQWLVILGLVIDYFSWIRFGFLLLLGITLVFKLRFEEKQLRIQFPAYSAYQKRSWRLLPFVY